MKKGGDLEAFLGALLCMVIVVGPLFLLYLVILPWLFG